jgi:hypothetical protein
MINIEKNSTNVVVLTLTEKSTLPTPYYLFEFTNNINRDNVVLFTGTDNSSYKSRYNRFNIIETGTTSVNLLQSTVNLFPPGMWDYTIYEQVSSTNLFVSGTTSIVEVGKVIVTGVDTNIPAVYR